MTVCLLPLNHDEQSWNESWSKLQTFSWFFFLRVFVKLFHSSQLALLIMPHSSQHKYDSYRFVTVFIPMPGDWSIKCMLWKGSNKELQLEKFKGKRVYCDNLTRMQNLHSSNPASSPYLVVEPRASQVGNLRQYWPEKKEAGKRRLSSAPCKGWHDFNEQVHS